MTGQSNSTFGSALITLNLVSAAVMLVLVATGEGTVITAAIGLANIGAAFFTAATRL